MKKILFGALSAFLIVFGSCTKKVYIPVESTTRTALSDTLRSIVESHDTIISRDSIIIIRNGDSIQNTIIRERWKTRILHDTISRTVHDTVRLKESVAVITPEKGKSKSGLTNFIKRSFSGIFEGLIIAGLLIFSILAVMKRIRKR